MLNNYKNIAVIGAGTMGIGIAEVAASKGQLVKLYDVDGTFAKSAIEKMSKRLESRVKREKITTKFRQQILDNIQVVSELNKLCDCQLIIEAIIENLSIKQSIFKNLQKICNENTLYASNTSSLSITAIASVLDKPENMIGLHFFNPAPVMKLVEVVAGMRSSIESINTGIKLCEFWQKTSVIAKSTPGFIVNRVARPFYGEALKMLQEQVGKPVEIDVIMKSAGFRMGPFTLMDLIGIDINLAVSKTVYANMYNDPRYRPSLIQEEMVAANLLGKKTKQGFYDYNSDSPQKVEYIEHKSPPEYVSISKDDNLLSSLEKQLKNSDAFFVTEHNEGVCLQVDECAIMLCNGLTCDQRVEKIGSKYLAQIDLVLDFEKCPVVHLSFNPHCPESIQSQVIGVFQALKKEVFVSQDVPAMIAMRIVCLLINEAADAIENGVCNENDVDLAMQKGVNYPIGLIAWAHKIGIGHVIETLDNLHQWFGDDRYRVSPWLRKKSYTDLG